MKHKAMKTVAISMALSLAAGVTSFAAEPFRSESDIALFASTNPDMVDKSLLGDPGEMGEANGFRIPALLNTGEALIASVDTGSSGADWGDINIAVRRSLDQGQSWSSPMDIVLSGAKREAILGSEAQSSSFYIDTVLAQAANGDVLMLVDYLPESGGLGNRSLLERNTPGYVEVEGNLYQAIYAGESRLDNPMAKAGQAYTVRENGWIYTPKGEKTNYYLPQNHSGAYAYETIGDMYYAVGEADYLNEMPPMVPAQPEGDGDIYAGNIYLSKDKPEFTLSNPVYVQKQQVGDSEKTGKTYDAYGEYECTVTKAAPLRAPLRSYLFLTRSSDHGASWSQPVDITGSVMTKSDGFFLGTGPGVGVTLQYQTDAEKNGRIIMPVYRLGKAAAIYSDDNGVTWQRAEGYINNVDEWQLIEQADGTLMSFGRQTGHDVTPVSYSKDGGETWGKRQYTGLESVRCQKSVITYPIHTENMPAGLEAGKQYVLASHPTGNEADPGKRTNGAVSLGVVEEEGAIRWLYQRKIAVEGQFSQLEENQNYFAYSCLTVLNDGSVGLLYESQPYNYLSYATFNLEWVMEGEAMPEISATMSARTKRMILIIAGSVTAGAAVLGVAGWGIAKGLQKKKRKTG